MTERERAVAAIVAGVLGTAEIAVNEDFFDAGGDSPGAVQLISLLDERFGVKVPMRRFLADPTPAGIAGFLDALCPALE
jgi:(S)-beta-tyrosine adenylation enzyme